MRLRSIFVRLAALCALVLLSGQATCTSTSASPPPPPADNPCLAGVGLDPEQCLMPWPSSAFLVQDPTTRTGYRIHLPPELLVMQDSGAPPIDPTPWNSSDGFSPMTTLLAEFAQSLDPSTLPSWHDPGKSLDADSPTVLVDVDTGARIAHFAEIEGSQEVEEGHTEIYIRPAARLAEGHHYAVGIRFLKQVDGSDATANVYFSELRDGKPSLLDARRAAFERDVFAPLVAAGVDRSTLLLAWDFRTGSGEEAWTDLVGMRDTAVALAGANGLGCTVTNVTEDPSDTEVLRQIDGTFTVPNFLETAPDGTPRILRDASGKPIVKGNVEASFTAIVPRTTATAVSGGAHAPLWVYGHGLFSTRTEALLDFSRDTSSKAGSMVVATDYLGLTMDDLGDTIAAVRDMSKFPRIIDRLRQGLVNTVLLPRTIAGACASLPAFSVGGNTIASASPSDWGYFGNSMGGTMGMTLAAISPDMDRFAIGVGGVDFPVMMPRTQRWGQLQVFFEYGYPRRIDRDLLMVMAAQEWDLAEPSSYAPHILSSPLPGSHVAKILFQTGLNDADVTNVASELATRTLGITELTPTAHAVWGLTSAAPPLDSGYVVYDLGLTPVPDGTLPAPADNGVHEGVRRDPRAQAQLVAFLRNGGSVIDSCSGACAPATP